MCKTTFETLTIFHVNTIFKKKKKKKKKNTKKKKNLKTKNNNNNNNNKRKKNLFQNPINTKPAFFFLQNADPCHSLLFSISLPSPSPKPNIENQSHQEAIPTLSSLK